MRVAILSIVMILWITDLAFAQKRKDQDTSDYILQSGRIEFEIDELQDAPFHIVSGGEKGLLLAEELDYNSEGEQWKLNKLDTALNVIWTRLLIVPYGARYTGYDFHSDNYYMLFSDPDYNGSEFILYEIEEETGNMSRFQIKTVFPISLTEFEVLGNFVLLSGHTNYRPVMMVYDFIEKKPKVLPGIYDRDGDIQNLIVDDDLGLFTVLLSEKQPNRKYTLLAKTFTASGDLIQEVKLDPGKAENNILDGVSTNFYGGFQYISGTYSKKPSAYSRGLYLSKFVNGRQQFVKYHEYAELDNFFGYMSTKRENRIKERIKRKAAKGKSARFNYKLLVHDIIPRGDEFLLVAEAFYPRYSNYYGSPSYNQSYYGYMPGFIGYNFTHAIVVAFDRNGNIKWDASFAIDNVLTYALEEFVSVSIYENEVVLMYLDENEIQSKVVREDEISEGKTFMPVKLAFEGDEVKTRDPDTEGLKYWYDQTMYAYGKQRIKNEQAVNGKVYRTIFYINKVQYHQEENPK